MSKGQAKKDRRYSRYVRNVNAEANHKREAWAAGELLKENHNGGEFSPEYSEELARRLVDRLMNGLSHPKCDPSWWRWHFHKYVKKIIELILHWPSFYPKSKSYEVLKSGIERYWDELDDMKFYEVSRRELLEAGIQLSGLG